MGGWIQMSPVHKVWEKRTSVLSSSVNDDPSGLQRPSGLAGWLDALKACTDVDVLWTGLSRGETDDAREKDDAVTSTGTLDVLNVGLMGTLGMDGDVAVVAVAGGADVDAADDCTDIVRLLRASGETVIPEQRRRDSNPIESLRSLSRSRNAWLSSTVVLDSCGPIHGKRHFFCCYCCCC